MDRFCQFSVACTRMALEDSGIEISEKNSERTGISLGSALAEFPVLKNNTAYSLKGD